MRCANRDSGCPGANNNNCNPYRTWSGTPNSDTNSYRGQLSSGSFGVNTANNTNAYGVRCVPDLTTFLIIKCPPVIANVAAVYRNNPEGYYEVFSIAHSLKSSPLQDLDLHLEFMS